MDPAADLPWWRQYHPWGWTLLLLALLTALPDIDFRVSALFFDPKFGFVGGHYAAAEFVRRSIPRIIIVTTAVFAFFAFVGPWAGRGNVTPRKIGYLAVSLIAGPGLIVESLLKPHWGRARPDEIVEFGGALHYTPPLWISDACSHNCSFASGHAAVAFWLTAYAFIVPPQYYRPVMTAGVLFGAAVGLVRVMQGAHFISDVAYAGAIVVAVNMLVARLMLAPRA